MVLQHWAGSAEARDQTQKPWEKPEGGAQGAAILRGAGTWLARPALTAPAPGQSGATPLGKASGVLSQLCVWILNCSDTTGFWRGEAKNTGEGT